CGWSFKRYEHLKRHMLVHTGERPYSCHFPGCGKSFTNDAKSHICPRHMRIHTLERPFSCSYAGCQKSFSRSDNLSQH
ncbi:C2H2-type zinc finger transcription factor, partial [Mucor lusitanicus CBS 277.49]